MHISYKSHNLIAIILMYDTLPFFNCLLHLLCLRFHTNIKVFCSSKYIFNKHSDRNSHSVRAESKVDIRVQSDERSLVTYKTFSNLLHTDKTLLFTLTHKLLHLLLKSPSNRYSSSLCCVYKLLKWGIWNQDFEQIVSV